MVQNNENPQETRQYLITDLMVDIVKAQYGILPMSVGTGASRQSALLQLEELGLTAYFDHIVTSDDVTRHKPEPETFLECARLMGVNPEYCQVFEDGLLGMEAARDAGMILTDVRPYINYGNWTPTSQRVGNPSSLHALFH